MITKTHAIPVVALSTLLGTLASVGLQSAAASSVEARPARYRVTVTNLTRGQVMSPAVVATHSTHQQPIWTLGAPASPELAQVAEDAVLMPLISALGASPRVGDVTTLASATGPIPPGTSASVVVRGNPGRFGRLSLVGMLVTTNDAFYGLNGIELPRHGEIALHAVAYDAGSEANTEMCAHIPGPPCGNAGVRVTAGAEGFVHVHAGVHGVADLVPAQHDWRNPVALVRIERM